MATVTDSLDIILDRTANIIRERSLHDLTFAAAIKVALGCRAYQPILDMPYPHRVALTNTWLAVELALKRLDGRWEGLSSWLNGPGRTPAQVLELIDYVRTGRPPSFIVT